MSKQQTIEFPEKLTPAFVESLLARVPELADYGVSIDELQKEWTDYHVHNGDIQVGNLNLVYREGKLLKAEVDGRDIGSDIIRLGVEIDFDEGGALVLNVDRLIDDRVFPNKGDSIR